MSLFLGLPYHRPKLCPDATWNPNGTTLAPNNTIGTQPSGIFINKNNTIFVTNYNDSLVYIWLNGNYTLSKTLATNSSHSYSIFVNDLGDIYLDSDNPNGVDVWKRNTSSYVFSPSLFTAVQCHGLFIDTNDSLYCSLYDYHKIGQRTLNSLDSLITIIAGTSCQGFLSDTLHHPWGIFVDTNFDLYVADHENYRIQRFSLGQSNGVTMAGRGAPGTIDLNLPTGISLDANGYLFILDSGNNRIVGSGSDGFRCVIGCSDSGGSASDQLDAPLSMAFDSDGGIFVTDSNNGRVQYFQLSTNSCSKYFMSNRQKSSICTVISILTGTFLTSVIVRPFRRRRYMNMNTDSKASVSRLRTTLE